MEAQAVTQAQVETKIDNLSAATAFGLNPPIKKSAVAYLWTLKKKVKIAFRLNPQY